MSQTRSRVKKFAQYREEIAQEKTDQVLPSQELQPFMESLHKIDQDQFKQEEGGPTDLVAHDHQPLHLKSFQNQGFESLAKQDVLKEEDDILDDKPLDASFNNDYLKNLIDEVKQYNIDRGTRQKEDTRANVLEALRPMRKEIKTTVSEPDDLDKTREISMQVEALASQPQDLKDVVEDQVIGSEQKADSNHEQLLEVTSKLKLEMEEQKELVKQQEEEVAKQKEEVEKQRAEVLKQHETVEKITDRVERSDRIINIILFVLIVAFICVSGFLIYQILRFQGLL